METVFYLELRIEILILYKSLFKQL